ncbi:SnoaL-like domain-containing protein [Pseudonocardia thermophila]|jgi:Tyrosyl-tRNA synthetase|uniref:SnoaL-like domain-containing protein n=1 Tax=Pseudonocardia thermophila TaxID=1848 RepID=A0A1M6ZIR6_PSETH|nr:nuclear transport factor 2 family protein [Pseudonocardia thermophila]SHL30411.1 SnoaL-like domain-containing protein [Pseudonocardia thermophila]
MPTTTLDELADRQAIAELVARFGRWLDGDPGDIADFYALDAEVESPRARLRGRHAIAEFLARTGDERAHHLHTDLLIDLDGDRAVVSANQLVNFFEPGVPPYRTSGLRVTYTVARTDDGWRIVRSRIELQWLIGELPTVADSA